VDEIDPKLRAKYAFLFKEREMMAPSERRWKWVRRDCLPDDMLKILSIGASTKEKTKDDDKDNKGGQNVNKDDGEDFITQLNLKNWLELDYQDVNEVKEISGLLKEERIKGMKFSFTYHVQVLSKMVDQFKPANLDEIRLKINILLYLIGTLFMTVRTELGFFNRDQWNETASRINQLLDLVSVPEFQESLI